MNQAKMDINRLARYGIKIAKPNEQSTPNTVRAVVYEYGGVVEDIWIWHGQVVIGKIYYTDTDTPPMDTPAYYNSNIISFYEVQRSTFFTTMKKEAENASKAYRN